jgi:hypothetical protein
VMAAVMATMMMVTPLLPPLPVAAMVPSPADLIDSARGVRRRSELAKGARGRCGLSRAGRGGQRERTSHTGNRKDVLHF